MDGGIVHDQHVSRQQIFSQVAKEEPKAIPVDGAGEDLGTDDPSSGDGEEQ